LILIKIFKFIFFALIVPAIGLWIVIALGSPKWLVNTCATVAIVYMYSSLLFLLLISSSQKGKYNKKTSLYEWMDQLTDYDEKLTYQLQKNANKYQTIDNLTSIKATLMNLTSRNKLYKAYYNQVAKENAEELYFKAALALLSSVAVFSLRDLLAKISLTETHSGFIFMLLIFITIAFFSEKLSHNKKRVGLLIEIIDICIEEIEVKDK
jgi:hypothetical protein